MLTSTQKELQKVLRYLSEGDAANFNKYFNFKSVVQAYWMATMFGFDLSFNELTLIFLLLVDIW